jgi:hypothetical protein
MSAIGGIKVRGVRIVVHDRHERDRSSQACSANNKATFVRHSTGGEVERYEELTSITDAVFGMYKDRAARIAGHSHIPTGGRPHNALHLLRKFQCDTSSPNDPRGKNVSLRIRFAILDPRRK